MICQYCKIAFSEDRYDPLPAIFDQSDNEEERGILIKPIFCPECKGLSVKIKRGIYISCREGAFLDEDYEIEEELIYPQLDSYKINWNMIPEEFRRDYVEAETVINSSPKSSAALSRRLLQNLIQNVAGIKKSTLFEEIEALTKDKNLPSYLIDSLDIVRRFGNIAAHPKKSKIGEILNVEQGEAEWCLELIRELFDFLFIKPKLHEQKKQMHKR